ncbi:hypothetical protein FGB62_317g01 [Gracilaria domingensis]|nr:hypothetical protein FGB62_317g01 [Gracilaria domingensis]
MECKQMHLADERGNDVTPNAEECVLIHEQLRRGHATVACPHHLSLSAQRIAWRALVHKSGRGLRNPEAYKKCWMRGVGLEEPQAQAPTD